MKTKWLTMAMLAAGGLVAEAGPFQAAQVPAEARWVLHVDADQLRMAEVGKAFLDQLSKGKGGEQMNALTAVLGTDLRRDLSGLTLYGLSDQDRDSVAVLAGRFNTQQLETLLRANTGYRAQEHNGLRIHSWIDEAKKKRMYGSAPTPDLLVAGGTLANVQAACDLARRQGLSLQQQNPNGLPLPTTSGPAIVLAAADMAGLKKTEGQPNAKTLRQARAGSLQLQEEGGQLVGRLQMEAADAQSAKLMADAGRGLLAMAKLDDKADAATLEMLEQVAIEQDGARASMTVRMPAAKAAVWLRTQMEKDAQKKAAAAAEVE